MSTNTFGKLFRITTFGESHGKMLGVVIDGCPAGLSIHEDEINETLQRRAPGKNEFVSPRKENDVAKIVSGVFENKTTGTPITILIENSNADSNKYEPIKDLFRPGHANFTYLEKYGIFDYAGGGRASARETVCRVAAGVVAKKILDAYKITTTAFVKSIGLIFAHTDLKNINKLKQKISPESLFCPDEDAVILMKNAIKKIKDEGDSIGGAVEFIISNVPAGLGEPLYDKLESRLASAMLSIPATKGFEIGDGFLSALQTGSEHNDLFEIKNGKIKTKTNHAGGVLAGISTGMPIIGRVAFKPTPSILLPQKTLNLHGKEKTLRLPEGSKHDPCVAIRAVPVVEAMCALVIADFLLLNRSSKL